MKTIGLIGGMSWESTVTYYQVINETVREALGGFHSTKILLYSVDFDEIERCQSSGDWKRSADILADAAKRLKRAGADFVVICTNTMHKVAAEVRGSVSIPLLHIAEVTARKLKESRITKVGLLGTCYTMTQPFYMDVLKQAGIDVLAPEGEKIQTINDIIFNSLREAQYENHYRRPENIRTFKDLERGCVQFRILGQGGYQLGRGV